MDNSPTMVYLLGTVITALIALGTGVITWLVRRNDHLETRLDETNKASAKLVEKVPDLIDANARLQQRISDLERRP